MLCRHLSAHKLSATEEQPSQSERGTEHCVREREREREREEGRKGREPSGQCEEGRKEEERESRDEK